MPPQAGSRRPSAMTPSSPFCSAHALNRLGDAHPPWRGPSFPESADSNVNLFQKHPHRQMQEQRLLWPPRTQARGCMKLTIRGWTLDRADLVEMLGCSSWCKACTAGSRLGSFYPADAGVPSSEAPAVRGPRGTSGGCMWHDWSPYTQCSAQAERGAH